jgi:hypothetical protein
MTASELLEADHGYDFAVANPRVSDETRAEAYTFADLKRDLELQQYQPDNDDAKLIVRLMNEVGKVVGGTSHVKRCGNGILFTAIIDGLKARVKPN